MDGLLDQYRASVCWGATKSFYVPVDSACLFSKFCSSV